MSSDEPKQLRATFDAWIPWLVPVASIAAHWRVLRGSFYLDDYLHLFSVANGPLRHVLFEFHGGHLLIFYNFTWWLLHSLFGANATPYFASLLLLHGLNAWLLFRIIRTLAGSSMLAAFGALVWGMSPLAVGSLGWVSVLGHVTATTAVLWTLCDLVHVPREGPLPSRWTILRWYLLLLVAASSFGIGLAAAMTFALVVYLIDPIPAARGRLSAIFGSLVLVVPLLYLAAAAIWAAGGGQPERALLGTDQTLIFWRAIPQVLMKLFAFGLTGLLLGPLWLGSLAVVSEDVQRQAGLMIGTLGLLVVLGAGFVASGARRRRQLLAMLVVAASGYGAVAIARWYLAAAPFAERYHYLSTAAVAVALCLSLASIGGDRAWLQRWGRVAFVLWLCVTSVPYALSEPNEHPSVRKRRLRVEAKRQETLGRIEGWILETPPAQDVHIRNRPFELKMPKGPRTRADEFPGWAGLFIISYPSQVVRGRRVYFVETDEAWISWARSPVGGRLGDLLVDEPPREP